MRTFPYMDGDRLIELVDKRELDAALAEAVKRMEDVSPEELIAAYWHGSIVTHVSIGATHIRNRLIQAALLVTPNTAACGQCADKAPTTTTTETA